MRAPTVGRKLYSTVMFVLVSVLGGVLVAGLAVPTAGVGAELAKVGATALQSLPREIETLINAKHENLISVFDIFRSNHRLFIFMGFAANGDISGYMKKHGGINETKLVCKWFLQASRGLAFLHNQLGTCHRDIKPDNILLDANWVAMLSDFGFAKIVVDEEKQRIELSSTFCGTRPYEAPQVLECKPYNGLKADIWSMGVTLFVMLHDTLPFPYKDLKEMLRLIGQWPKSVTDKMRRKVAGEAINLQLAMLNPTEKDRASVNDLVDNEWLKHNAQQQ